MKPFDHKRALKATAAVMLGLFGMVTMVVVAEYHPLIGLLEFFGALAIAIYYTTGKDIF